MKMTPTLISAGLCFLTLFKVCRCCPFERKEVLQEFDISKITGAWWEYQIFNSQNQNDAHDHECLAIKFYPDASGNEMTMVQDFIRRVPSAANQEHTRKEWPLSRDDYYGTLKLGLFAGHLTASDTFKELSYTYYVLGTDYSTWLLAAFCSKDNGGVQVLTTKQDIGENEQEAIEKKIRPVLKAKGITRNMYTIKNNGGCKSVNFPESLDD